MKQDLRDHLCSVIVPIHNGEKWINRCFNSILEQMNSTMLRLEICVCDDGSDDDTPKMLIRWTRIFEDIHIPLRVHRNECPQGVGAAKNRAFALSSGNYLCFQDIDDYMLPQRLSIQLNRALQEPNNTIIGCQFRREPESSTARYTKWANSLTPWQLTHQIYTSHGPTVIMPTWFCHRNVFTTIGGFIEKKNYPEDLHFFYKHLDLGGGVCRVDDVLVVYTFHANQTTFSIEQSLIWNLRVERLQKVVLSKWTSFTIWNAKKQGRRLYRSLSVENQHKLVAFCDVDIKKIGQEYCPFNDDTKRFGKSVKICHFTEAKPPFVICVKLDLTNGNFEENLRSLNIREGSDYVLFS